MIASMRWILVVAALTCLCLSGTAEANGRSGPAVQSFATPVWHRGTASFYGDGAPSQIYSSSAGLAAVVPGSGASGGSFQGSGTNGYAGSGGGAGAFLRKLIANPASTYAYVVGQGGTGGAAGTQGSAGAAGGRRYRGAEFQFHGMIFVAKIIQTYGVEYPLRQNLRFCLVNSGGYYYKLFTAFYFSYFLHAFSPF